MTIISISLYGLLGCFLICGSVSLCCACPRKKEKNIKEKTSEENLLHTETLNNNFLPPFQVFNPDFPHKRFCVICDMDIKDDEGSIILHNGGFTHRRCVNYY